MTAGCSIIQSGAAWWNRSFAEETGKFHVELTATPSGNNIDAVVGLSNGPAANWTKLAAIVRFSPAGVLDARKGGAYAADVSMPYQAGRTYKIRMDVDITRHIYSVYVADAFGTYRPLAKNYAFRTEQASVTRLNNIASYLEPSRAGNLNVCGIAVVHDDSFGDACIASDAGGTFSNIQLTPATGVLMAHFTATPSAPNMDGVVGFALGNVDAYNDFAASLRFYTNGMIEVRDGDVYRADWALQYQAGRQYAIDFIIDIPSKTYSVRVDWVEIARGYKFRTQQAGVTGIDHAATIVASTTGHLDACRLRNETWAKLSFAHRGYATVNTLFNGNLVFTDETQTWVTNANGVTLYSGGPTGIVATYNDNLYIARSQYGILTLASYTPTLALRYTRTYAVDGEPDAIGVYTDGTVAVSIENRRYVTFNPDGSIGDLNLAQLSPTRVAIMPYGFGIVRITSDGMTVESYTPENQLRWQRYWAGSFEVEHFVPRTAAFVLTGQFHTTVDFGDGPMVPYSNPETSQNTFLLSLTANGVLSFSKRFYASYSTGLDANDSYIGVGLQNWTQTPWLGFEVFDSTGNGGYGISGVDTIEGFSGGIAVNYDGRAYVNLAPMWTPNRASTAWEHVFAFTP